MTDAPELLVAGVGLWLPGVPGVEAWQGGARGVTERDAAFEPPSGASIERRARRRASPLTRALADVYEAARIQARIDNTSTASVFGSALGEVATMLVLLDQMGQHEPLSPMGFATSVHSAASGVVSISGGNRGFTTSISAHHDTVAAALTEAYGLVATMNTPVIVACGDENSPDKFVDATEAFDMLAAAVAIVPPGSDAEILARVSIPGHDEPGVPPVDLPPRLGRNPQAGLVDLVATILDPARGRPGIVGLDRGRGRGWSVRVQ
jgi:hypothetical protein